METEKGTPGQSFACPACSIVLDLGAVMFEGIYFDCEECGTELVRNGRIVSTREASERRERLAAAKKPRIDGVWEEAFRRVAEVEDAAAWEALGLPRSASILRPGST